MKNHIVKTIKLLGKVGLWYNIRKLFQWHIKIKIQEIIKNVSLMLVKWLKYYNKCDIWLWKRTDVFHGNGSQKDWSLGVVLMSNFELVEGKLFKGGLLMYLKDVKRNIEKAVDINQI